MAGSFRAKQRLFVAVKGFFCQLWNLSGFYAKIYEISMVDKSDFTSNFLIVNRYSNDNYTLIVVKSKKNNNFNEVSRISFEIKRKGKKFKIAKIGLFSS